MDSKTPCCRFRVIQYSKLLQKHQSRAFYMCMKPRKCFTLWSVQNLALLVDFIDWGTKTRVNTPMAVYVVLPILKIKFGINIQVQCGVTVKKNFTEGELRVICSGVCRTSLHMTWPEPQRRCDEAKTPHPRNILLLWTSRHLDGLINLKQNISLNNGMWGDVRKAYSRNFKLNIEAKLQGCKLGFFERGGACYPAPPKPNFLLY